MQLRNGKITNTLNPFILFNKNKNKKFIHDNTLKYVFESFIKKNNTNNTNNKNNKNNNINYINLYYYFLLLYEAISYYDSYFISKHIQLKIAKDTVNQIYYDLKLCKQTDNISFELYNNWKNENY